MLPGRNEYPPAQNQESFGRRPLPTWTIRVNPYVYLNCGRLRYTTVTTKTLAGHGIQEHRSHSSVRDVTQRALFWRDTTFMSSSSAAMPPLSVVGLQVSRASNA